MSEATEVPMICVDCGGTLTDDDAIWSPGIGVLTHINFSQCIASLGERLTVATKRAEAAEAERDAARDKNIELHNRVRTYNNRAKKLGQKQKKNHKLATYAEESNELLRSEREALRKDAARLDWMADEPVFEGFADSPLDVFELESIVAEQNGRSEPTQADRREAFRRMIDAALAVHS